MKIQYQIFVKMFGSSTETKSLISFYDYMRNDPEISRVGRLSFHENPSFDTIESALEWYQSISKEFEENRLQYNEDQKELGHFRQPSCLSSLPKKLFFIQTIQVE